MWRLLHLNVLPSCDFTMRVRSSILLAIWPGFHNLLSCWKLMFSFSYSWGCSRQDLYIFCPSVSILVILALYGLWIRASAVREVQGVLIEVGCPERALQWSHWLGVLRYSSMRKSRLPFASWKILTIRSASSLDWVYLGLNVLCTVIFLWELDKLSGAKLGPIVRDNFLWYTIPAENRRQVSDDYSATDGVHPCYFEVPAIVVHNQ